jgi:hypothetical protein
MVGNREMLWIQYELLHPTSTAFIAEIVGRIATLTAPYPVAAFDNGEHGVGLIVKDHLSRSDDLASVGSSVSSEFIVLPLESHEPRDRPNELSQWQSTVDINPQQTTLEVTSDAEPSTTFESSKADNTSGPQTSQGNEGAGSQGTKPDTGKGYQGTDANDEQEDDELSGRVPHIVSLAEKQSSKIRKFGTFIGLVRLFADKQTKQELEIRFDLQILPEPDPDMQLVNCRVAIHRLVVRASRMYDDGLITGPSDQTARPYFVLDEICIIVGPSRGQCLGPRAARPAPGYFIERQTNSTNSRGELSFEASASPKAIFKGAKGSSRTTELPPISLVVTPISIGCGGWRDFRWHYKVCPASETQLEMSFENPPTHETTYEVLHQSGADDENLPDNFKVESQTRKIISSITISIFKRRNCPAPDNDPGVSNWEGRSRLF